MMHPAWLFLIVPASFMVGVFVGGLIIIRFARQEAQRLKTQRMREFLKEFSREN